MTPYQLKVKGHQAREAQDVAVEVVLTSKKISFLSVRLISNQLAIGYSYYVVCHLILGLYSTSVCVRVCVLIQVISLTIIMVCMCTCVRQVYGTICVYDNTVKKNNTWLLIIQKVLFIA